MNETNYIYEGDTKMALLKEWRDAAYSQEMDQNTLQQFWGTYFELEKGCWVCVRPSGTEPKIKLYINSNDREEAAAKALNGKLCEASKALIS